MNNEEFKEIMNRLLNAKLTDFCGKDTYEILTIGSLFRTPEEKNDMLNYTLRDFIKMYSKILPAQDEIGKKLPGEENFKTRAYICMRNEFKRKVYLHTLYNIILTGYNPNRIISDETVEIIGNEYFIRNNDNFDSNLKDIIREIFKMKIEDYFYKIGSLYVHSINQQKMLSNSYSELEYVLRNFKFEHQNTIFKLPDDSPEKIAMERTIDEIEVGSMLLLYQRCDDRCDSIRDALLLTPFRIACDLTDSFWISQE